MSTHNIGFCADLTKIIFQLSSNMHLIPSSVVSKGFHLFYHELMPNILSKQFKLCSTLSSFFPSVKLRSHRANG